MSSVTRNTRSKRNPSQAQPAPVSEKIKITIKRAPKTPATTTTVRQEATQNSEREAAITKLVNTETRIAAKRAANLRSLARPLPGDSQAGSPGGGSHSHDFDLSEPHSTQREGRQGDNDDGGNVGGSGNGSGDCGQQTEIQSRGGSAHTPILCESNLLCPSSTRNSPAKDFGYTADSSDTNCTPPPTNYNPSGPGKRLDPNFATDPNEETNAECVANGVREKERRGGGIRNEVAERLRLRTNRQADDHTDSEESDEDLAPTPPSSKRRRPPPPPTMYVPSVMERNERLIWALALQPNGRDWVTHSSKLLNTVLPQQC